MKRLFAPVVLAAALSGCVAMPYDEPYPAYYSGQPVYRPYAVGPAYAMPGTVYGPPAYAGPPVRFGFGLNYRSGVRGFHGHHHGFGHHHHGFGPHYFGGARGGWRH